MRKIDMFWWRSASGIPNLGDELMAIVLEGLFDVKANHASVADADALGAGSILDAVYSPKLRDPSSPAIGVLGAGLMHPTGNFLAKEHMAVYGVRGYLTRASLYADDNSRIGLGDPGLLAGLLAEEPTPPEYDVGFIPHISYFDDPRTKSRFESLDDAKYIDIRTSDLNALMSEMLECRIIVSQSLHGLIIADSLGLPNAWLSDFTLNPRGGNFKFYDYFSSVRRPFDMAVRAGDTLTNSLAEERAFHSSPTVIANRQREIVEYISRYIQNRVDDSYEVPSGTIARIDAKERSREDVSRRASNDLDQSSRPREPIVDIVTVTMGREFYLIKTLDALIAQKRQNFRHILVLNACTASQEVMFRARKLGSQILVSREPMVIGAALNFVKPFLAAPHVLKLDDDAVLVGDNFTHRLEDLLTLIPKAVFSPYPVGLIGSPGGPSSKQHTALYSAPTDTYYTLRKVGHVGGFARVSPRDTYDNIVFDEAGHTEDTEFSEKCRELKIPMYYLENALIVEHSESTVGQGRRDESYFMRTRNWYKTKSGEESSSVD